MTELRQAQLPAALDVLIKRCHAETRAFLARASYDERPCLELLRRAIAEDDQDACAGVCEVYSMLVRNWILTQNGIVHTNEEPGYLVNQAFERLFRCLKPEALAGMKLAQVMGYLRRCAVTTVIDAGRRSSGNRVEMVDDSLLLFTPAPGSVEDDVVSRLATRELFVAVWSRCNDDRERVLAARSLLQGWTPREIAEWHADLFPDVKAVYRRRSILVERMRDNQQATGWANRWVPLPSTGSGDAR